MSGNSTGGECIRSGPPEAAAKVEMTMTILSKKKSWRGWVEKWREQVREKGGSQEQAWSQA